MSFLKDLENWLKGEDDKVDWLLSLYTLWRSCQL